MTEESAWQAFGQALRSEREMRGIDLEAVAAQTKYSTYQLRSLEEGQVGVFPALVFVSGAVKAFAKAIGADAEQLQLALLEAVNEEGLPEQREGIDAIELGNQQSDSKMLAIFLAIFVASVVLVGGYLLQ